MKFQIYWAEDGWRWRLRAKNGEIIASGESYKNKGDCVATVSLIRGGVHLAEIEYVTSDAAVADSEAAEDRQENKQFSGGE